MQVKANINGRDVVINYGTNPSEQVTGVWAEANGVYADLTPKEQDQAWDLAILHHAAQQAQAEVAA